MPRTAHGPVRQVRVFSQAQSALDYILTLYQRARDEIVQRHSEFVAGDHDPRPLAQAFYPYIGLDVAPDQINGPVRPTYGSVRMHGTHGTTVTRPDLFYNYLLRQLSLIIKNHGVKIKVGLSDQPIPLPFMMEEATANLEPEDMRSLSQCFAMPDLATMDDKIANGVYQTPPGQPFPLSLFDGPRTDLALQRLSHYTGTDPQHFQGFVLLTNYQRYVNDFIVYAKQILARDAEYVALVGPGNEILAGTGCQAHDGTTGQQSLPPMPAYHLVRRDGLGVTLINIGVGPANAKTITDHVAVLRPHCWLMIGHCGGLRRSQRLGDYVLAHAYVREDHVLDQDLPTWVPVPPIAEVQVALEQAVSGLMGVSRAGLKNRLRTGTVASTDNRNWEFRYHELYERFSQSRAIAIDMESATIAANGFRLRVPYGTLLCVSDKPMHGELKLRSMANAFYKNQVEQHLKIGLETIRILRESGVDALHSRKLRSFDEPAFR